MAFAATNAINDFTKWLKGGWQANVFAASFKGVPFSVISCETEIGKRAIVHQYAWKDEPWIEDLGLDKEQFTIHAFVIANKDNKHDYFKERNAVLRVIKEKDAGKLIHPFYGEKWCMLMNASISESFMEGGICRFILTFAVSAKNQYPVPVVLTCELPTSDMWDDLAAWIDAVGTVLDDVQGFASALAAAAQGIKSFISGATAGALGYINSLVASFSSVMSAPCDMAQTLMGAWDGLLSTVGLAGDALQGGVLGGCSNLRRGDDTNTYNGTTVPHDAGISAVRACVNMQAFGDENSSSVYSGHLRPIVGNSTQRDGERRVRDAMIQNIRDMGLITAIQVAQRIEYRSQEEAAEIQEMIVAGIEDQLNFKSEVTTYNTAFTYNSMETLKNQFVKVMANIGAKLPTTRTYTPPPEKANSLAVAFDLYEDIDEANDIRLRNRMNSRHPLFIQESIEVKVA